MISQPGFQVPRICLPRPGIDLRKWAVVACDQHTSEPAYWAIVDREVGDEPSSLHLIFPEVLLGTAQAQARIDDIRQTMKRYLADGLLYEREGAIYIERTIGDRIRRGVMLELDLEHYDFSRDSTSLIRPTEDTIVARLAPRIEVRSGAELELPHILVLIDDPAGTVIEPIGAVRGALTKLYDTELMLGGGRVAGYGVGSAEVERAIQSLHALANPAAFAARYGVPAETPVMLFAVGDGNHSLATAKSIWDRVKGSVGMSHPSRFALVEVVNIHDPALEFSPIHRLMFDVTVDVRTELVNAFGGGLLCTDVPSASVMRERVQAADSSRQVAGLIGPGARFSVIEFTDPPLPLVVGTLQAFLDRLIERGGATDIDYVHGDEALERLSMGDGIVGFHLPTLGKGQLLQMVVREGPLPRKTFSMGEAHEKRYYVEARRIRQPDDTPLSR